MEACRRRASVIRHRSGARADREESGVGSFRRGEHFPHVHRRNSRLAPRAEPVQNRDNLRRDVQLRHHRRNLQAVRQPRPRGDAPSRRLVRQENHRVAFGGRPLKPVERRRMGADEADFRVPVPADGELHDNGKRIRADERGRRFSSIYTGRYGEGAVRRDKRDGAGDGASLPPVRKRRLPGRSRQHGQLLAEREEAPGFRHDDGGKMAPERIRRQGFHRIHQRREARVVPVVDDRQNHAAPERGNRQGARIERHREHAPVRH